MPDKIPVTCPKCHSTGMIPPSYAGHTIHCKKCDSHFPVPTRPAEGSGPRLGEASHPATPATAPAPAAVNAGAPKRTLTEALAAAPPAPAAPSTRSLLDALGDTGELTPLTAEDEKHARDRYEARVLSKDRSAHYDENGNLLSDAEYARKLQQKKSHNL